MKILAHSPALANRASSKDARRRTTGRRVEESSLSRRPDNRYNACIKEDPPCEGRLAMNDEASAAGFPAEWRKVLNEMLRAEVTLSEQEILGQMGQEKPLREFLEEMRALAVEK
jgi:hypothetical protein